MKGQNRIYEGPFKEDLFHGMGKLTLDSLDISFEGVFQNGNCALKGKITYIDTGDIYEGEISSYFRREGKGKMIFKNGDIYEG